MKHYRSLLQKIIIAILSLTAGYQAGSPDSAARAYFSSTAADETSSSYESALPVERIGDLVWRKITCDTLRIGNFAPHIHCDTAFIFQAWAAMKDRRVPKPSVWEEQVPPPAPGYELHQVYQIRQ